MTINLTVPTIFNDPNTNIDFKNSSSLQENGELINRTKIAINSAATQILEAQKAILINPPHPDAKYFHPKILQLAKDALNPATLDDLRMKIINAGITRGILTTDEQSNLPTDIDEILMNLIKELINDITLLELTL